MHITGSNNFTFEATVSGEEGVEGQALLGTLDGDQPIEVIIEGSSLVKFQDARVRSVNGECDRRPTTWTFAEIGNIVALGASVGVG